MNSTIHVSAQSSGKCPSTPRQWVQLPRMAPGFSYKSFSSHNFKLLTNEEWGGKSQKKGKNHPNTTIN